jgi:hypothetical protein
VKALAMAIVLLAGFGAEAQRRRPARARPAPAKPAEEPAPKPAAKEKTFDFAAMGIEGRVLAPQLLYMLGRIKVELERAGLEKRSFIPELVRSVDEGGI